MGAELNQKLFSAADSLRGKMSADQNKEIDKDADLFSYPQYMIEAWEECLFHEVVPLRDELK